MAKTSQDETGAQAGSVGKLMAVTMEALAIQLGVQGVALDPEDGEGEVDYVARVVPLIGEAAAATMAQLSEELAGVRRQLASQRGAATKARRQIEIMQEAARPRRLGPVADALDGIDLMTALDAAEEITLAFSDGKNELKGVAPRRLPEGALVLRRDRVSLMPDTELLVTPPGGDTPPQTLAGVALLIDGEQVAWSPLSQPMALHGGVTLNLATVVAF